MALSTILVLLTQAWIAWCFRLEATVNREVSDQGELSLGSPGGDAPLPEERGLVAVQKQVEWYLGDENLHHDKFFHDKISADPEGWLEVKFILTCNRVRAMGATTEEFVLAALKGSNKVEVKRGEDGAFIRRPKNAPLPKWEPKPKSLVHAHDTGIIAVFQNIPVQQNSSMIKEALKTALPLKARLWFVSGIDDKQRCFCATAPFEGDKEFFESLTLVVGGAKLKPELCQGDLFEDGLKLLPNHVIEKREREAQKLKENAPIIVGTQRFVNVGALRAVSREKEIISTRFESMPSDYNTIKASNTYPVKVLDRVHSILTDQVTLATQAVSQLNTSFAPWEVARKIVKYMYHSAKREELYDLPIEEACARFVKFAMSSYELGFGEREWFFKLDLAPAFAAAAWELLKSKRGIKFDQVRVSTREAFEEYLDSAMLNKGLWEATRKTFPDAAVHKKVYIAVQKTHRPAFEATIAELKPEQELERVHTFLERWIRDSMTKAWNSVADAEKILNVSSVSNLFQNMLSPFGTDDPFSTIPSLLTEDLGPPPKNWAFVNDAVKSLFKSWGLKTGDEEDQPPKWGKKTQTKEYLDSIMLNNGIWEASNKTFNNSTVSGKVYAAVQKTYREAFNATMMDAKAGEELQHVQDFLKRWISGSMTRAWNSLPDAERVLTVNSVTRLFQHMLAPFGPYETYSTIPTALTEKIGPLPRNWNLVNDEVRALFSGWRKEADIRQKNLMKDLRVGDEAILRVKFGKWKGDHAITLLEKVEEGWKVSHDVDGYVCVINWKDIKSGKLAFLKITKKGKRTKKSQANKTVAEEATKEEAVQKSSMDHVAAEKATAIKAVEEEGTASVAAKPPEESGAEKATKKAARGKVAKEKRSAEKVAVVEAEGMAVPEKAPVERALEEAAASSDAKNPADEESAAEKAAAKMAAKERTAAKRAAWKEMVAAKKAEQATSSGEKAAVEVAAKMPAEEKPTKEVTATSAAEKPAGEKSASNKAAKWKARAEKAEARKAASKAAAEKTSGEEVAEPLEVTAATEEAPEKAAAEGAPKRPAEKTTTREMTATSAAEKPADEKRASNKAAKEKAKAEKAEARKAASKAAAEKTSGEEVAAEKPVEVPAATEEALAGKAVVEEKAAEEKAPPKKAPSEKAAAKKEAWKEKLASRKAAMKAAKENTSAEKEQAVEKPIDVDKSVADPEKAIEEVSTTTTAERPGGEVLAAEKAATKAARKDSAKEKTEARNAARKAANEKTSAGRVTTEQGVEKPVEGKAPNAGEEKKPAGGEATPAAKPAAKGKAASKRAARKETIGATTVAKEKAEPEEEPGGEQAEARELSGRPTPVPDVPALAANEQPEEEPAEVQAPRLPRKSWSDVVKDSVLKEELRAALAEAEHEHNPAEEDGDAGAA